MKNILGKPMKLHSITKALIVLACAVATLPSVRAVDVEPAKVQLTDRYGVNLANGQVTHSMNIVNIGGPMGLSDTISIRANEFDFIGYRGFNHKYFAQARDVNLSQQQFYTPHNIMRVYDFAGSADFRYVQNGQPWDHGDFSTNVSYVSMGDERQILEATGNFLDWTKPDGTVVRFLRAPPPPGQSHKANREGFMASITYANGLVVTIDTGAMSVRSNTGWQIKRFYASDPRFCSVTPHARSSDESGWARSNPSRVVGINAAIDRCAPFATTDTAAQGCALTKSWPTATFSYPACMPDIMTRTNNQIAVTTAAKQTTTLKITRQDLALKEDGSVADGHIAGQQFSARLTGISAPNSTSDLYTYYFKNLFITYGNSEGWLDWRLNNAGVVTGASRGSSGQPYDLARPNYSDSENVSTANQGNGVYYVRVRGTVQGNVGAIDYADTDQGRMYYENSTRNFPTLFLKTNVGMSESYGYTRSNLSSIGYYNSQVSGGGYSVLHEFPAACSLSTRKTCNQPTRSRDANGNWTDYEYHAPSGQISKVTQPANKSGVRAQTRFEYGEQRANYHDANGSFISGSPIWMKTAEKYCINSAAVPGGGCSGNDEVVTRFEYNHNNLLLTGVTVAEPGGVVRRTCYRYDVYGNQIGVTTPKANLGSCP
jgi:hypothetical protein